MAKLRAGAAVPVEPPLVTTVQGRIVTSRELAAAMEPLLTTIAAEVSGVVAEGATLTRGLDRRGVTLTGGGARLAGIDRFMSARLGIPVQVAADPETCVARGASLALERLEVVKRNQLYTR